jgi:hypothetical protein
VGGVFSVQGFDQLANIGPGVLPAYMNASRIQADLLVAKARPLGPGASLEQLDRGFATKVPQRKWRVSG